VCAHIFKSRVATSLTTTVSRSRRVAAPVRQSRRNSIFMMSSSIRRASLRRRQQAPTASRDLRAMTSSFPAADHTSEYIGSCDKRSLTACLSNVVCDAHTRTHTLDCFSANKRILCERRCLSREVRGHSEDHQARQ